jgi:hypothetical protein
VSLYTVITNSFGYGSVDGNYGIGYFIVRNTHTVIQSLI